MKFDWAIWKPEVVSTMFHVMPEKELPTEGFSSVYRYTESDALSFRQNSSYKGFRGSVYSEKLKVDADDAEAAGKVESTLKTLGVSFSRFTTGNRGKHFLIKRDAVESPLLPAYDKWLVAQLFPDQVDTSIYHHVAMYRQPGCVHVKTGKPKKLELWRPGTTIPNRIEEFTAHYRKLKTTAYAPATGLRSVFSDPYLSRLTRPLRRGERHLQLIKIARQLCRLGQTKLFALEFLRNVLVWSELTLVESELRRIVDWAFEQR